MKNPIPYLITSESTAACVNHRAGQRHPWIILAALALAMGGDAQADQFVLVDEPGWVNSSQYSIATAWGDYDKDGFLDLYVANVATPVSGQPIEGHINFLYRNRGDGTFSWQSEADVGAIATDVDNSLGGFWGDFDNDGWLDLLAQNAVFELGAPPVACRLYRNRGDGGFSEIDAGDLSRPDHPTGWAALADYDVDGCLDVFVGTAWYQDGRQTNTLFRGSGDGTFGLATDNEVATTPVVASWTNDATWADYDNDGDPDLLLANAEGHDFLFRNDGHGQFTRQDTSLLDQAYTTWHHAWGDFDNDGYLDVASGGKYGTRLFRNLAGTGMDFEFINNWTFATAAAPVWADYDNDGNLDLLSIQFSRALTIRLFRNRGDGAFDQVSDVFTQSPGNWTGGGGWADYDNDGFMDLFLADATGQNQLYHNTGNANRWLKLLLEGTVVNRTALGARVRVKATIGGKEVWQMREVSGGNYCQCDLRPNFGLGDATKADLVRIEWPSGSVTEFNDVAPNQMLTVTEPPQLRAAGPGSFQIRCWKGQSFEVQSSSDLSAWTSRGVITNLTGTLTYTDPDAGSNGCRFYRVVAH